ncbi:hypothetical protein Tco_0464096, partial [Tanacetum coccineum]
GGLANHLRRESKYVLLDDKLEQGCAHKSVIVGACHDLRGIGGSVEGSTVEDVSLRVANSHTGNHHRDDFTPLETIQRFIAYKGEPSVDLLRAFLNLGPASNWLTLSNRSGPGVPKAVTKPITHIESWKGYFNILAKLIPFELEGEAFKPNGRFAENTADSDDAPSEKDEVILVGRVVVDKAKNRKVSTSSKVAGKRKQIAKSSGREPRQKARKVPPQASKASGDPSDPLDVDSDPDIPEFPSAKELKDFADCHWVVAHVTPPLWKQNLKEISLEKLCDIHDKAYMRDTCDVIRERERDKDKAYTELEVKCNDALQDLDKNPLVLDMYAEIETLQGQVNRLHGEYSRLVLKDKSGLTTSKLLLSFVLKSKPGDNLATASYPFLTEAIADPYAPLEVLLSKKLKSLRSKSALSQLRSKPSSSKSVNPTI